jgi:hypothetical protein
MCLKHIFEILKFSEELNLKAKGVQCFNLEDLWNYVLNFNINEMWQSSWNHQQENFIWTRILYVKCLQMVDDLQLILLTAGTMLDKSGYTVVTLYVTTLEW